MSRRGCSPRTDLAYYSGDRRAQPAAADPAARSASSAWSRTSSAAEYCGAWSARSTPATSPGDPACTGSCCRVYAGIMTAPRARSWPRRPCSSPVAAGRAGAPAARRRHRRAGRQLLRRPGRRGGWLRCEPPAPGARAPPRRCPRAACASCALGGLGEIGRNMTVFEHAGRLLVVDCGVLFPEDRPARRRPDPARLRLHQGPARRHRGGRAHPRPRGPHRRGAVPAAREGRHPDRRLAAHPRPARGEAHRAPHRRRTRSRSPRGAPRASARSSCEFFAVNHSIPDALAVAIRTPAGLVLHTGDFKMDQLPLDGRLTDLSGFARLGDEGVDLLLVDSTNAEVPGFVTPERDIAPVLDRVFARGAAPGHRRVASPATCTASSRCSTRPRRTGARSRSSAARWSATWASPATWATCDVPAALLVDVKSIDDLARRARSC